MVVVDFVFQQAKLDCNLSRKSKHCEENDKTKNNTKKSKEKEKERKRERKSEREKKNL